MGHQSLHAVNKTSVLSILPTLWVTQMDRLPSILQHVKPVLLQGAFIAALGVGAKSLRYLSRTPMHPLLNEYPDVAKHPPLQAALTQIAHLGHDVSTRRILEATRGVLQHDAASLPSSQSHITRLSQSIMEIAKRTCEEVDCAGSDEMFRRVLDCQQEAIPQLQVQLDDILHNHLLSRTLR